ncbi:hypothetical protein [Streptomyces sp. NPDC054854]
MICGTPVASGQGRTAPRTRDLPPYPASLFWYVTRHLSRPGSPLRALPHRLVPLTLYPVVVVLVLERFGTRLL